MISQKIIVFGLCVLCLAAQQAATDGQPDATPVSVEVRDGKITVAFRDSPLHIVCSAISSKSNISIIVADGVAEDRVTLNVSSVPADLAIRQLLTKYDTFLFYGGSTNTPPVLRVVWVYPKGSAADIHPVPRSKWAGTRELESALNDSSPQVRGAAYEALLDRPDGQSRSLVLDAIRGIRERDSVVRERLLSTAITKGFPFTGDVLSDLARTDVSEQIRWMALDTLAFSEYSRARVVAEAAATDSSELVRTRANEILAQANASRPVERPEPASRPPDPIQ